MSRKLWLLAVAAPLAVVAGFVVVAEVVWAGCDYPAGQIQFASAAGSAHCLGVSKSPSGEWFNQFTLHHNVTNTIIVQRDNSNVENLGGLQFRKSTLDDWAVLTSGGTSFTATADTNAPYYFKCSLAEEDEHGSVGVKVAPSGENARCFSWMLFADE